jgi:hypothetical protein
VNKGTNTNPVLDALRDSFDAYDAWGSALSAHFDIAECLYRNGAQVPEAWEFRPSPMLNVGDPLDPEDCSYFAEQIEHMMREGQVSNLIHAGNVLARYVHLLKLAGKDY